MPKSGLLFHVFNGKAIRSLLGLARAALYNLGELLPAGRRAQGCRQTITLRWMGRMAVKVIDKGRVDLAS